jgi:RNA polymerase sigma factor (sigma-70 family)
MKKQKQDRAEVIRSALDRYESVLVRYAMGITGNLEQARDVVQDTFMKMCAADMARIDDHIGPWLYTVCRNRALDVRKKEGRMAALVEGQAERVASRGPAPNVTAEMNETHQLVLDVLKKLPERDQELFRLKIQDGMTYREVSRIANTSVGTVSTVVHRVINAVKRQLRDQLDLARDEI